MRTRLVAAAAAAFLLVPLSAATAETLNGNCDEVTHKCGERAGLAHKCEDGRAGAPHKCDERSRE